MQKRYSIFMLSAIATACMGSAFAAKPVDLAQQPASFLQTTKVNSANSVKEISRSVDFNNTTHIRVQQTYAGHTVWGADAVAHVPNNSKASIHSLTAGTTMNGIMYQNLEADLGTAPSIKDADKALLQATKLYQQKTGLTNLNVNHSQKDIIVYIDSDNKAHWAVLVSFIAPEKDGTPSQPTYILDAQSLHVYQQWNNAQTVDDTVDAGGFGGNPKLGKLVYDGLAGNLPSFKIKRDASKNLCTLENADVASKDASHQLGPFGSAPAATFPCANKDSQHNNLYWSGDVDAKNEGYSPANDAFYIGEIIKNMYKDWYDLAVLSNGGVPLKLKLNVHVTDFFGRPMDNAMFMPLTNEMYFGDGAKMFYPLTSLGVGAHEMSHGFTSQHSNLTYKNQSGGLNESFSDMAAQAAEFYAHGTNNWQIGPEIFKGEGALRYMDDPTKDGKSIGHVSNYNDSLNVHHSSGIFNKVFYLMSTAQNWDTKKAFDVMVKANMHYWTANSTFADAACGVIKATKDYNYDVTGVNNALTAVGISAKC